MSDGDALLQKIGGRPSVPVAVKFVFNYIWCDVEVRDSDVRGCESRWEVGKIPIIYSECWFEKII